MTREEFESILEECFIEGYNSALEDIQEDILDEEAYDLERDYDYYTEGSISKHKDRQAISRAARLSEKLGIPRDVSYRMSQKAAQGAYAAAKGGAGTIDAIKKGAVASAKDYVKTVPLHDRINQRGTNDKLTGVGKNRKSREQVVRELFSKAVNK